MGSVPLKHLPGTGLTIVGILSGIIDVCKLSLIECKICGDILDPALNDLILADIDHTVDSFNIIKAVLNIVHELALCSELALIKEVRDHQ